MFLLSRMESIREIVALLAPSQRVDVREQASIAILSITGTQDGMDLLKSFIEEEGDHSTLLSALCLLEGDVDQVSTPVRKTLVNLSASDLVNPVKIGSKAGFWRSLLSDDDTQQIRYDKQSILANILIKEFNVVTLIQYMDGASFIVGKLCRKEWTEQTAKVLHNLTQVEWGRKAILRHEGCMETLFKLNDDPKTNREVRHSVIGVLRNLCFDAHERSRLINEFEIAAHLLLPMITSELVREALQDDLTEKGQDAFSPVLRNKLNNTTSLEEYDINDVSRKMIIEAMFVLCTSKVGREELRKNNVYLVIRAYHPFEDNEEISDKVFELVDLLLGDEDEEEAGEGEANNDPTFDMD